MPARPRLTPAMVGEASKRKMPPVPEQPMQVDFDLIPMAQVIRIERLAGVRLSEWGGGESDGQKIAALVAVMYDVPFDTVTQENGTTLAKYIEIVLPTEDAEEDDDSPNA
jgi:hypothetical protein